MENKVEALYLENQLCFPLYAASRLTTKIYSPWLKEIDLTYPQYLVMMVLWQHGNQSVNQIGSRLFLESNTITPLLKRLEQKGLISRQRSASDERSVQISLTQEGEKLKQQALQIPAKITASFTGSTITPKEIQQFHTTLFKLLDTLGEKASTQP